jgi:hypothetical protein
LTDNSRNVEFQTAQCYCGGALGLPIYLVAEESGGRCELKKDSDAIIDNSEIKKASL